MSLDFKEKQMTEDEYGDYRFVVDGDYIEIVEKSSNKTVNKKGE